MRRSSIPLRRFRKLPGVPHMEMHIAHTILKYVCVMTLHQLGTMEVQLMLQKVHYIWNKTHHGLVLNLWFALLQLNFLFFKTYFEKL
jgi:hypothetical protein